MQIKNIKIFDSIVALDGAWIDVSNLVLLSVQMTGVEGGVWIEVSNDQYININGFGASGAALVAPPIAAPLLSQEPAAFLLAGYPVYPAGYTLYVKTTYTTSWGETTASSESSIAMVSGNILTVTSPGSGIVSVGSPPPGINPTGLATGYNVYIGTASGAEVLQTMPQYVPAHTVDATPGLHFAISGAIPLSSNFTLANGIINSGISPPTSSTAGGIGVGTNVLGTSGTFSSVSQTDATIAIFIDTNQAQAVWTPSGMVWKWLRVRKSTTAQTKETIAWLCGANG